MLMYHLDWSCFSKQRQMRNINYWYTHYLCIDDQNIVIRKHIRIITVYDYKNWHFDFKYVYEHV